MTAIFDADIRQRDFWDRIAPKYARQPIKDMPAYRAMLERLCQSMRLTDNVLEIGCGTGSTALILAEGVGKMTATDISGRMIEIARSKLDGNAPANVTFKQADATDLIAEGSFDVVFASSLLHLVEDVPLVLRQAFRQLKPGGLLITKTVCLRDAAIPTRMLVPVLTRLGIASRLMALSSRDLQAQMAGAGFEIERVEYFGKNRLNPFIIARRPEL